MSVTIDSLDIQIRSSAGSAAANIDRLATSLGNLRANAKLTVVSNNLTRLSEALGKLQNTSTGLGAIKGLAGAMKSLSGVQKASGLNSTITILNKVPEMLNNLDTSKLTEFSLKIRSLASALAPLSTQLEKVGTTFSKIPANVSKTITATNRMASASRNAADAQEDHNDSLDKGGLNLATLVSNIESAAQMFNWFRDAIVSATSAALEWDGIQYRFGRAFGEDAEEVLAYVDKVSETLLINKQELMQFSSLYGSLLKGFGLDQEKVTTISIGLSELTYDIWAANNDRYKTLEDASEAVRSAITGEIEPIRNAGIPLTEASMQEYLDSVGMATVSVEQLSEAQKAEVRYAVMVNSALNQGIVGTYAKEMNTAEGAVRTLTQQLKTLTQAFGSLFIPILSAVLPYLTAFVSLLIDAVVWLGRLFGFTFQKIDWGGGFSSGASGLEDIATGADTAAGGLGSAAKAAKKLKDYTMGFDELNVIDPTSASSGGGGGGGAGSGVGDGWGDGLDLDTLWDESVFAQASKQVDEVKQKIMDFFDEWKVQIAIIAGALAALTIAGLLTKLGEAVGLGKTFLDTMKIIKQLAATAIVIVLQYSLMSEFLGNFIETGEWGELIKAAIVGALGTLALYSMWGPTGIIISLGVIAAAAFSAVFENGGITNAESAAVALAGIASAAGAIGIAWKKWGGPVMEFINAWKEMAPQVGPLAAAFPKLSGGLSSIWGWLSKLVTPIATFVGQLSAPVLGIAAGVIAAIASAVYFCYENWGALTEVAKNFFKNSIQPRLDALAESWAKIKETLGPVGDALSSVVQWFKNLGQALVDQGLFEILGAIGDGFLWLVEAIGGVVVALAGGALSGAFTTVVAIVEGVAQAISGALEILGGAWDLILALFGDGSIKDAALRIVTGVGDAFSGLWDATVGAVIAFFDGVIEWFTNLWDELVGHSIVPDTVDAIVEWFLSLPGKILQPIQDFCTDVANKFKGLWDTVKQWWSAHVAPKFTLQYWKDKFAVIGKGISEKLDEAKKFISEKWSAITSWFTTNIAPKLTLQYWKDKFANIGKAIKNKLDEFKQNVKDKWGEIKKWFTDNIAPKFTLQYWLDVFKNLKDGFSKTIKNAVNAGIDLMNNFISHINSKLNFSWDGLTIAGKEVFKGGSMQLFTIPMIPRLENGGVLEDGLFTMNRGEIAGRFNNGKSVVANNQMIVDGIAAGVYEAVVAAMNATNQGGSTEQNVNVYLDGKQIYASVKKTESERGLRLMGNQLGYSY